MTTKIETYIPLYRKYRPQQFADVVGQEAIVQTLGNAIATSKIAHAYLFCGPRGTGKTSTARIFAKSLNCRQGPTVTPCQECESCTGITRGNALDVVEFDAASNNGVEDARELIENCQFAPMAGRYKVYIIDEVHMLTPQAFNALLKTLEEPPPNVIFIFATTEAHKVLPTIISRCQRFDFTRITVEDIARQLRRIADAEAIRIDDEALMTIARHARGGMRDAVGLLDQVGVIARAQPDITIGRADVSRFIGSLEEDVLIAVTESIADHQASELLSAVGELINRGIEPAQLVKDLTQHFRNLFLVKAAGPSAQARPLGLPEDYFEKLRLQAERFSVEELPQMLEALAGIERNIRASQQTQLWLEVGLLEMAYRQDIHLVKDLARRVEVLESQLAGGAPVPGLASAPAPVSRPASSRPGPASQSAPAPQPVQTAPAQAASPAPAQAVSTPAPAANGNGIPNWHDVVAMVASPPTKALLDQHSFLVEMGSGKLTVGCSSEPILESIKNPTKFFHLQKAVEKYFGQPMTINLILEKNRPDRQAGFPAPPPAPTPESSPPPAPPPAEKNMAPKPEPPPAAKKQEIPQAGPEPEMADDDPPPDVDRPEPVMAGSPGGRTTEPPADSSDASDPDLAEAKKYTVELLQGKLLD